MNPAEVNKGYDPADLDAGFNVVELNDVVKRFGKHTVLDQVSYTLKPGSVFALLGENGAGKTTTIRLLLGEMKPDAGTARVLGLDPALRIKELREKIGYVPEFPTLYDYMTIAEQGKFAAAFYPRGYLARFAELCEEFQLDPRAKIRELSKGMKAKTSLALAMAHDPNLLILDEPTSGLDVFVRRQFLQSIADLAATGKTIFLSSHQTAEVERIADHVAFMKSGKIVLVEELETLKSVMQKLVITLSTRVESALYEELFSSLFTEGLVSADRFNTTYTLIGRKLLTNYAELLAPALGEKLASYEVEKPSLEEIFAAYMRGA